MFTSLELAPSTCVLCTIAAQLKFYSFLKRCSIERTLQMIHEHNTWCSGIHYTLFRILKSNIILLLLCLFSSNILYRIETEEIAYNNVCMSVIPCPENRALTADVVQEILNQSWHIWLNNIAILTSVNGEIHAISYTPYTRNHCEQVHVSHRIQHWNNSKLFRSLVSEQTGRSGRSPTSTSRTYKCQPERHRTSRRIHCTIHCTIRYIWDIFMPLLLPDWNNIFGVVC